MSLTRLFKEKKTPEEIQAVREARTKTYFYIQEASKNISNAVSQNILTPETAVQCSTLLTTEKQWLNNNPSPDTEDVTSHYDILTNKVQTLIDNDKPKIQFKNGLLIYEAILKDSVAKGAITKEQYTNLHNVVTKETEWYKKNVNVANELDFQTETQKMTDEIKAGGINSDTINEVKKESKQAPEDVKKQLDEKAKKQETLDLHTGASIAGTTALQVFYRFLLLVLRILSGSFAANLAIGRPPIYRLLYFIYGTLPYCMPFVILYTIYRRIVDGPIPMYAILPVSIDAATTHLGKYLWYPFYWVPDQDSMNQYTQYQRALQGVVIPVHETIFS